MNVFNNIMGYIFKVRFILKILLGMCMNKSFKLSREVVNKGIQNLEHF